MTSKKRSSTSKRQPEKKRRGHRTPEQDAIFFAAVARAKSLAAAAEEAGYTREAVRNWRNREPEFKATFDEAYETGTQTFEDEARRRALVGVERPVFHQGEVCGHIQDYSDTLLIFLLKGRRPHVYRENYTVNGQVEHQHTHEHVLRSANERAMRMVAEVRQLQAPEAPQP